MPQRLRGGEGGAELAPDLVFLDIQMPKLDGFEVLELIGRDVAVVFVTAFDEHAIRAFEVNAVDYLLKPVAAERASRPPSSARASASPPARRAGARSSPPPRAPRAARRRASWCGRGRTCT